MQKLILHGAAMLMAMSAAAFAQTTATPGTALAAPKADAEQQNGPGFRQELRGKLEQAGFTDITIVSDSYIVQALDKAGAPVTMLLNPDSMTLISGAGPATGTDAAAAAPGMFTALPAKEDMSSKVVGLTVYNAANQNIGTIKDLAFNGRTVQAYVIGVGGFLGMGDHYVAVRPSALKITWNAQDKTWHAALDTTADALKAAPEYKYPAAS